MMNNTDNTYFRNSSTKESLLVISRFSLFQIALPLLSLSLLVGCVEDDKLKSKTNHSLSEKLTTVSTTPVSEFSTINGVSQTSTGSDPIEKNTAEVGISSIKIINKQTKESVLLVNPIYPNTNINGSETSKRNDDVYMANLLGDYHRVSNKERDVYYDNKLWDSEPVNSLDVNKISATPEKIAKVVSIDDNSLDYSSQAATKYRFMENDAPYFDLVDSEQFIEIDWYFANGNDSEQEKQTSRNHAEKAHLFARQLMGVKGGELVADMLLGKTTKSKKVGDIKVALAKCEFYSCMLVLHKNDVTKTLVKDEQDSENKQDPERQADSKKDTQKLINTEVIESKTVDTIKQSRQGNSESADSTTKNQASDTDKIKNSNNKTDKS